MTDLRRPLVPPPAGHETRTARLTARRALLRLLTRYPNRIVTHAEVEAEVGEPVSHRALSNAATSLRADIAIRTKAGPGGGYVLCIPEWSTSLSTRCNTCEHFTVLGHCRELDREVLNWQRCWAHRSSDAAKTQTDENS